jgi:hypothetical protein
MREGSGLQSRLRRFDPDPRLQFSKKALCALFCLCGRFSRRTGPGGQIGRHSGLRIRRLPVRGAVRFRSWAPRRCFTPSHIVSKPACRLVLRVFCRLVTVLRSMRYQQIDGIFVDACWHFLKSGRRHQHRRVAWD